MGIKDNFSQAVKELWKKDGQDQTPARPDGQPTELDNYLKQGEQSAAPQQPSARSYEPGNAPLETPYYRDQPFNTQNTQQAQNNVPLQNTVPEGEPGVNMNVQNIRQNFGQNTQNAQADPAPQAQQNGEPAQGMGQAAQTEQSPMQSVPPLGAPQNAQMPQGGYPNQNAYPDQNAYPNQGGYNANVPGNYGQGGGYGGGGYVPPAPGVPMQSANEVDETTIISKNTIIDGNVRSLANMQIDGNIKGNVETTRNIDMSGKIIGDITCNNAGMNSAAMQGNVSLKGRMKMDRDTILIGDLSSQYADINGRIRGKLDIVGKAELKRDAIVFGDINASTIAVTDGAIIQGYVNTTFLSKEDSRNVFPEAISIDKDGQSAPKPNQG
ncbi:MAG: hypothetical protein HDT43_08635 [Ruminococcaceae bacterium]|nr:hypothetical protein [Oscillospiraceae bacterium]